MNRRMVCFTAFITFFILSFMPRQVKADELYTVTFRDWEGNVISEDQYHKGDTITIPDDPEKPSTEMYCYSFSGWDPVVSSVCTGDVTYDPLYLEDYMRYTVRICDSLGGSYRDSYGIYGSEAVMLQSIRNWMESDMIISRDQASSDNMNGKLLWCDFRACVELGLIDNYDPTKQYFCTGFKSSIDGRICKLSDFDHYYIRGNEDYTPVYEPVDSTGTNHMWFVDQFDPDDPERVLSYSEIDLGNTVLEWDTYEMYETQPILKFPFPEVIAGTDGTTYYLNPYKARIYIGSGSPDEYVIPRIFLSHGAVPMDWDARGSYVLPIYSSSPDFEPPDDHENYAWVSMDILNDEGDRTGSWESGRIIPGETYVTAPENPGVDVVHWGHTDRIFTGKYKVVLDYMSRPVFATINAGESFTADSIWWRYASGGLSLVPIWDEVETAEITYLDHDGTVLRHFHGGYYREIQQPPDPVKPSDRDFEYQFIGWKNLDTGVTAKDTSSETGGRLTEKLTYQAVYFATKVARGDYVVEIPAAFALTKNGEIFEGGGEISVYVDTNCDNYYVDVIPDNTINLTGQTSAQTLGISATMNNTRFYGTPFSEKTNREQLSLKSGAVSPIADTYTGTCSFTIRSGYE